jgi:predicted regulator of Ras-like GTPase activity (Roadblock/LC7/MglB family)
MARLLLNRLAGRTDRKPPIKIMALSVKSKFAGLLRGLLRQFDDRAPATPTPVTPPATAAAPPTAAHAHKNAPPARPTSAEGIELPLASIITALPIDLRAKLITVPPAGLTICLPAETVMAQLAFGAVKISFGELRQLAPGIFANTSGDHDNRTINLPLNEILSRLNPALLARRSAQKTEVSDDIAGPFGGRGQGITFTTQSLKTPPAAPKNPPADPEPVPLRAPVNLPSHTFTPPPRAVSPPTLPMTFPPRQTAPTHLTPPPAPKPAGNGNGHGNGNGNGHATPPLGMKFSAVPVPSPVPPPAARPEPAQPTPSGQVIFVSLISLAESWPEELRNEILRLNLAGAKVPLPVAAVEPGLKRGRVTLSWKQLRTLVQPASAPSPNDGLELDLPLKVLAPAFLQAQKNLQPASRKVSVSEEIPNLFFGFPQPAAEPVAAPVPAASTAPAVPQRLETKTTDTNYFGRATESETELRRTENPATDFLTRQAHPKEVVKRAAFLPGVAGAVVALPDGLRVASEVPADLNADTLAAFLPQIFERLNQSTRELRMGPLNNVSFTVGNVPWKIFRVSSVYFAAFGRAGENLPTAQLAGMAMELDRKKSK